MITLYAGIYARCTEAAVQPLPGYELQLMRSIPNAWLCKLGPQKIVGPKGPEDWPLTVAQELVLFRDQARIDQVLRLDDHHAMHFRP